MIWIVVAIVAIVIVLILTSIIINQKDEEIEYWKDQYFGNEAEKAKAEDEVDGGCADWVENNLPDLEPGTLTAFNYSKLNIISIERNEKTDVTEVWYKKWTNDKGSKLACFYFNIPVWQHEDLIMGWKRYNEACDERYDIAIMGYKDVGHDIYDDEWDEEPYVEVADGVQTHSCQCAGDCQSDPDRG